MAIDINTVINVVKPFIPVAWTGWFSGYGTYALGVLMIISGVLPVVGIPIPWVPPGSEGQWIAGGAAAFTVRRAIANKEKNILAAIKENTDLTKTIDTNTK